MKEYKEPFDYDSPMKSETVKDEMFSIEEEDQSQCSEAQSDSIVNVKTNVLPEVEQAQIFETQPTEEITEQTPKNDKFSFSNRYSESASPNKASPIK